MFNISLNFCRIFSKENNREAFLIISKDPGDRETYDMMSSFVGTIGGENILVDNILLENTGGLKENVMSNHRIPQPKVNNACRSLLPISAIVIKLFVFYIW